MKKDIKTTVVSYNKYMELDFKRPSKYYIRCATGDYIFIHCNSRSAAQEYVNNEFGKGKYAIRCNDLG